MQPDCSTAIRISGHSAPGEHTHTWGSRCLTGTVTSQLHSRHPKTAGEEAAPESNAAEVMGLGENGILSC